MKTKLICLMLIMTGIVSCKKDQHLVTPTNLQIGDSTKNLSLKQVEDWYKTYMPASSGLQEQSTSKTFSLSSLSIAWENLQSVNNKKGNYWLVHLKGQPTFQNVKQGYRKLAFIRDSTGTIQARILEIIPDVLYLQRKQKASTSNFTGRMFIYDQNYKLLGGQVFLNGQLIGRIKPSISTTSAQAPKLRTEMLQVVQEFYWIDSNYIDADGVVTVYSEQVSNTYIYDDGGGYGGEGGFDGGGGDYLGGGGGGGGEISTAPPVVNLPGEDHTKVNSKQFMDCFGNIANSGATMQVTVYVQEPFPGTSFAVGPNSVGHVAIGLTKSNGSTSVTQVLGFYPDATGLSKLNAPSKIVNNGGDLNYDVSITYTVNATQFNQITNYISNPPLTYDLGTFNCTNFVYSACQAGSITLPDANSVTGFNAATMSLDYSMTPNGLGSSIENLKGASNVNTTGGTTPNSKGPCN